MRGLAARSQSESLNLSLFPGETMSEGAGLCNYDTPSVA